MILGFGPWEPDSAGIGTDALAMARNVYPIKTGYGPIASLSEISTSALPDRCVGLASARTSAGGWLIFAATRNRLYRYQSGGWVDYTRVVGGTYNVATDEFWSFAQFGSQLIAVNINDDPQVIDVDTGATAFSALSGSPPRARYVSVVGDFAVLTCLASNNRKQRNSAINDATGWTVGTNLCDEQEFVDGGRLTGIVGGDKNAYVTQDTSLRQMIFQPGSDQAFRYERFDKERGAAAPYSVTGTANSIFFLSNDGFYAFSGTSLVPIGAQRVNKWFRANSDSARFFAVQAFTDPYAPRVYWAFYNSAGSTYFDRVLIYDWQLDRWSYAEITAQCLANMVTAGVTLEDLDTYGSIDTGVPYSLDSRVWEGGAPVIGAASSNGRLAFLEGSAPLTATLLTSPRQLTPSARSMVSQVEPLGIWNGATLGLRVGKRENASTSASYTSSVAPSTRSGVARLKASGRLHEFELTLTQSSGTTWAHAQGLDIGAQSDGSR